MIDKNPSKYIKNPSTTQHQPQKDKQATSTAVPDPANTNKISNTGGKIPQPGDPAIGQVSGPADPSKTGAKPADKQTNTNTKVPTTVAVPAGPSTSTAVLATPQATSTHSDPNGNNVPDPAQQQTTSSSNGQVPDPAQLSLGPIAS